MSVSPNVELSPCDQYAKMETAKFWYYSLVLKVLVLIHSLIPQLFSNIRRFWYQSWVIFRRLCVWNFMRKVSVFLREISKKPSWKLENMVSTIYKTISNINKKELLNISQTACKWDIYLQVFNISAWIYWLEKRPFLPV